MQLLRRDLLFIFYVCFCSVFCICVVWLPALMGIVPFGNTAIMANKYFLSLSFSPSLSSRRGLHLRHA